MNLSDARFALCEFMGIKDALLVVYDLGFSVGRGISGLWSRLTSRGSRNLYKAWEALGRPVYSVYDLHMGMEIRQDLEAFDLMRYCGGSKLRLNFDVAGRGMSSKWIEFCNGMGLGEDAESGVIGLGLFKELLDMGALIFVGSKKAVKVSFMYRLGSYSPEMSEGVGEFVYKGEYRDACGCFEWFERPRDILGCRMDERFSYKLVMSGVIEAGWRYLFGVA